MCGTSVDFARRPAAVSSVPADSRGSTGNARGPSSSFLSRGQQQTRLGAYAAYFSGSTMKLSGQRCEQKEYVWLSYSSLAAAVVGSSSIPHTGSLTVAPVSSFLVGAGSSTSTRTGPGTRRASHSTAGALNPRSRFAFVTTDSELAAIAAAAIIGFRTTPKNGYRMPAAIGMPIEL